METPVADAREVRLDGPWDDYSEDFGTLRYRVAKDPRGRYLVLPAMVGIVALEETYGTREAARQMAEWFNRLAWRERLRLRRPTASHEA